MGHEIIIGGNGFSDREFITRADGTREELGPPDSTQITFQDGRVLELAPNDSVILIGAPQEGVAASENIPSAENEVGVNGLRRLAQKFKGLL